MNEMAGLWALIPVGVKLLTLIMAGTAATGVARLIRIVCRISRTSHAKAPIRQIENRELTAENLAIYALTNRTAGTAQEWFTKTETERGRPVARRMLRQVESRFLFLCETCYLDLKSARRASTFVFLLSLFTIAYGAWPTWVYNCALSDNSPPGACVLRSALALVAIVSFGLFLSAVLYALTGMAASRLDGRMVVWSYFFRSAKDALNDE